MSNYNRIEELRKELRALEARQSIVTGSAAEWLDERMQAVRDEIKELENS
jgi:uncharacterized protein involved in exopolysaccharide biosynthesis